MSIAGSLTRRETGGYAGWIASLTFDVDVTLEENPRKTEDRHPDYQVVARSPRSRSIRIGSAWERRSRAGNDYLSLAFNIGGVSVRMNAIPGDPDGAYELVEWAN